MFVEGIVKRLVVCDQFVNKPFIIVWVQHKRQRLEISSGHSGAEQSGRTKSGDQSRTQAADETRKTRVTN